MATDGLKRCRLASSVARRKSARASSVCCVRDAAAVAAASSAGCAAPLAAARPVSSGTRDVEGASDAAKAPACEPRPKLSARLQAAGEAVYTTDAPRAAGRRDGALRLARSKHKGGTKCIRASCRHASVLCRTSSSTRQEPGWGFCSTVGVGSVRIDDRQLDGAKLLELAESCRALFVWEDGPLVVAMQRGELLLVEAVAWGRKKYGFGLAFQGPLVELRREQGRLDEAEQELGSLVADARAGLGPQHRVTLCTEAIAARLQHAQPDGAAAGAAELRGVVEKNDDGLRLWVRYQESGLCQWVRLGQVREPGSDTPRRRFTSRYPPRALASSTMFILTLRQRHALATTRERTCLRQAARSAKVAHSSEARTRSQRRR